MIVVTGAGSMGSMFGGLMSRAGHDVTLVDVNAAHMAAVANDGLTLQFPDGRTEVSLSDGEWASDDPHLAYCNTYWGGVLNRLKSYVEKS